MQKYAKMRKLRNAKMLLKNGGLLPYGRWPRYVKSEVLLKKRRIAPLRSMTALWFFAWKKFGKNNGWTGLGRTVTCLFDQNSRLYLYQIKDKLSWTWSDSERWDWTATGDSSWTSGLQNCAWLKGKTGPGTVTPVELRTFGWRRRLTVVWPSSISGRHVYFSDRRNTQLL